MKPEQQIKALAELAGAPASQTDWIIKNYPPDYKYHPNRYLTSYDAIIPLVQKQQIIMDLYLDEIESPAQLCEALLRATGKWKEKPKPPGPPNYPKPPTRREY